MDHQEFRQLGHEIIDWIADYMQRGFDGPVSPDAEPGDVLSRLPEAPPEEGQAGGDVFDDFQRLILPATTHWNDPRFFGYFPCNHSGPAILGDLLSAGLGVNAMSWATSPAATELEIRMMEWLGQMIGLPWPGVIQDTASTGTLCALLSAREAVADFNRDGFYGWKPLVAYTSDQAHSSVIKAVRMAGLGDRFLNVIPSNSKFEMDVDALVGAIERDRSVGRHPFFVASTIGTTSSTAIDPIAAIGDVCHRFELWHHVDAALAGTAAILPEMRWLLDGVDAADSMLFNPHKWMFTNFDCSAYFCRDPMKLKRALAIQPEYLKTEQDARVENFRDWSIQLGRRFRALKLWFVIRTFGVNGLRQKVRLHLDMAKWFARKVDDHEHTQLVVEPQLNTVCFHLESDDLSRAFIREVNASGEAFLTHTVLADRFAIRVSFGQTHATWDHVHALWQLVTQAMAKVLGEAID